jgi:PST family polysaccharide transporter
MLQGDAPRYRRYYLKLLTLVCVLTMPLSLFVAVYADAITAVVLGPVWLATAPLLCILSFGTYAKQAVGSTSFVLITRGESKTYLGLTVLHNATFVIGLSIGVKWGVNGIALAEVATTYLLIAPKLHFSLRGSPVTPTAFFANLGRPVAASIAMAGALFALRSAAPLNSAAGELALGTIAAFVAFGGAWLLIPGGKSEIDSVWADLRQAWKRKTAVVVPVAAVAAVS